MATLKDDVRDIARKYSYLRRNRLGLPLLRRYLIDVARYRMVRQGIPRGTSKQIALIRAEFAANASKGHFDKTWFDESIVPWSVTFSHLFEREDPVRILEIGSFQGRSSLFFLTYFPNGTLTAVDTWSGSDEHENDESVELSLLEARFDQNLRPCVARLIKRKGTSLEVLPKLLAEKQEFDIAYVDGSHFADDVLTDGVTAWRLLTVGGVMIFDDLTWQYYARDEHNPAWAIKCFLEFHTGEYRILSVVDQLVVQKIAG